VPLGSHNARYDGVEHANLLMLKGESPLDGRGVLFSHPPLPHTSREICREIS